jgi:hypothetical protein
MALNRTNGKELSSEISALRKSAESLAADHGMLIATQPVRDFVLNDLTIGMATSAIESL